MRLYTFTHFMLSSIQQGIQASHAQSNLFLKYQRKNSKEMKALYEWAKAPTMICLNGGNSSGLSEVFGEVENIAKFLKLPYSDFCEDEDSMEGVRTSVSIVVPPRIYETAAVLRTRDLVEIAALPTDLHESEINFGHFLNKFSLAK